MNCRYKEKINRAGFGAAMRTFTMALLLPTLVFILVHMLLPIRAQAEEASKLDITLSASAGGDMSKLKDASTDSTVAFGEGNELTVTAAQPMQGLYIKWKNPPTGWTLVVDGAETKCGQNGFLHEYVELPSGTTSCVIRTDNSISMCDIFAYGDGELPRDVQVWEPAAEKADFLVFSTHADDEILFLGGVLVEYAGKQKLGVQLVYMTNYWDAQIVREHEKLDGIWECGVKNYPVVGPFPDTYAKDYEAGKKVYNEDEVTAYMTEMVRRFKPLVVVIQDVNGEYGHGGHQVLAHAIMNAVDHSMEESFCPESVSTYGTYDVPKTYLHLYEEGKIRMDLRQPLDDFGGRTAVEVAADAYKKHVSQQWCWFYVSDDYQYSCADFGMYRTTVGADTGNDMMENLTSYEEQARIEAERIEQERLEEEKRQKEEQERLAAEKQKEEEEKIEVETKKKNVGKVFAVIGIVIGGAVLLFAAVIAFALIRRKIEMEKRRKRKLERMRRRRAQESGQQSASRSLQKRNSSSQHHGSSPQRRSTSQQGQRKAVHRNESNHKRRS